MPAQNINPINKGVNYWAIVFFVLILASANPIALGIALGGQALRVGGSAETIYDTRISDLEILCNLLFKEIFKEQDREFTIKIYNNDHLLSQQLAAGNLDAAFMNPVFYLDNIDLLNSQFTYAVQYNSTVKTSYLLLVRRDSGITTLADLRNKNIIIPSGHALGQRFLDVELMRVGLSDTKGTFSHLSHTRDTNTAIVNLFFGQSDAALVTDVSYQLASELNSQIPDALHIIRRSHPLVHTLISISKEYPPHLVEQFIPFTQVIDNNPRLKYLRETFLFDGVIKVNADDIYNMEKLNTDYLTLKRARAVQ